VSGQNQAILFGCGIIALALILGRQTINNTNEVTTVNTQTSTQTAPSGGGGGGGSNPLSAILGFL
jgi:hypothetical protein